MASGRWFVLLLVLVHAALSPLALASPPDQTWLGGLYDNADYDDVVLAVTSATATTDSHPRFDLTPTRIVVGSLPTPQQAAAPSRDQAPQQPRAPPAV
jgi:hypothetical protein